ncbi:alpha/beta hydrolase [Parasedimentitalea marina]|uniref:Alpha/beta hydrolase n=1 Tax=Parasedimentitalea marina TaxID=2483033 RepID=A0A3T0N764_9RHOB|nr:alpha/beta hydrolase [Parasedimentitalea marina]AZV79893.1 alpha/beta hydrolase [Parasedimentitalea marina]
MSIGSYYALSVAPSANAPLIFAFHGIGGDERQFFSFAQVLVPGAGVISPRGDALEIDHPRFFRRLSEGVFDMDDLALRTNRMIDFLAAWAMRHPKSPVYGFGYSIGATILTSVLIKQPNLFDRVGLLHPVIPWQLTSAPDFDGTHILITAGRNDPICPLHMTERLINWASEQEAIVKTVIHHGGHELRRQEISALLALMNPSSEMNSL